MGDLVAIDPGPHTGFFWRGKGVTLDLTSSLMPHLVLWEYLDRWFDTTNTFVVEDFEFRKDKQRAYINYDAGQYLGIIQLYCQMFNIAYHVQKAAVVKGEKAFWTDVKLKKVGLYNECDSRHSRDALRHWLHYDTFYLYLNGQQWLQKLK